MPVPYSLDLRQRVIHCIQAGMSRHQISEVFSVGTATIQRWWSRYQKDKNIAPKTGYQKGHSHKIKDNEFFHDFMKKNKSMTCEEIAITLGGMTGETVRATLKRLGYSRKKRIFIR
jgi:transposase